MFDDPSNRISYEGVLRLLNEAAVRTRCPHIGLLLGRMWRTSDLGLLGELVRHAPTVGAALQEFVVNHHLNSEGALAFVVQRDRVVDWGYAVYVPLAGSYSQLYDGALAALVSFLRELCGDSWSPAAVFLSHSAPADVAPYRQYFRAPLHFDSDVCVLRFGAHWLARPVAGADPRRLRLARGRALAIGGPTLVENVHRTLRTLLLHGRSSGADVAQSLAMHRRTLDRRLSTAGTTFQQVLDRVRFAVAKELLEGSTVTLIDITAALGMPTTPRSSARSGGGQVPRLARGGIRHVEAVGRRQGAAAARKGDAGYRVITPIAYSAFKMTWTANASCATASTAPTSCSGTSNQCRLTIRSL